jgi:hypothetical protein
MNDERPVDETPRCLPDAGARDGNNKRGSMGCLILFLLVLLGFLLPMARPNDHAAAILAMGGFIIGAALGAYVSVRVKRKPWYSSCRWAIYGLVAGPISFS